MNSDLEALLKAYDAVLEARDSDELKRLRAIFESRVDDAVEKRGLKKDVLLKGVRALHADWLKANRKQSTMPPKA